MDNDTFLSCDWGTSNFRLRLVTRPDLKIIAEDFSEKGISEMYKAWQATGEKDEDKRMPYYRKVIEDSIKNIEAKQKKSLDGVPVVISGMASSSVGMTELPYQSLPFSIDGTGLKTISIKPAEAFDHELIIISGVRSEDDVMRGEETQLVGSITEDMKKTSGTQLFIHPGTHSKHIKIENGQVVDFKTYMTGEFFSILTTHGILRNSVAKGQEGDNFWKPFSKGVLAAIDTNILNTAFSVRTNDLFKLMSPEENYAYLSGLLIGTELQHLEGYKEPIYLGCGASMITQYKWAFATLGLTKRATILPPKWVDESVIRGQHMILNKQ